jgi:hypothetical protein
MIEPWVTFRYVAHALIVAARSGVSMNDPICADRVGLRRLGIVSLSS